MLGYYYYERYDSSFNGDIGDLIYIYIALIFTLKGYFPQQLRRVNVCRNSLIGTVGPLIPLSNEQNRQYLDRNFSEISFLLQLHRAYNFCFVQP